MTTDPATDRAKAFCRREGLSRELVPMIAGLIDEAYSEGWDAAFRRYCMPQANKYAGDVITVRPSARPPAIGVEVEATGSEPGPDRRGFIEGMPGV